MKTFGTLWLQDNFWHLECEPHVAMWAKRIFGRIDSDATGKLSLHHSDGVCRDLEWFAQRFPLVIRHRDVLVACSAAHREKILTLDKIIGGAYTPRQFKLALPARKYQQVAAAVYLENGFLLLGDDVGLGKTVSAIATFTDKRTLPAIVVTLAHLPKQWLKECNTFAPGLTCHIVKRGTPYELPTVRGRRPDVLIINYHKLTGWAAVLAAYGNSVVFDEIQELRHADSGKYNAAIQISRAVAFALGLSATPIYNYGGEIFNVVHSLRPGVLGTRNEFAIEWCEGGSIEKQRLRDPAAFGAYLREQHIMLRRTRTEVGRELPGLQKITHEIDCDLEALNKVTDAATELASIILATGPQARGDKMRAAEEFNNLLRQATGIAKAPFVAAFVKMLIDNGEPVLLYGWHRAVYEIWLSKLEPFKPALFTGTESPNQKQAAIHRFTTGDTPLLIMSLRSGAGVDGLQGHCRTVVFGELDWSPGVHEQNIGRIYRDGQRDPVAAYFLLASDGADPIMAETLGLKREQIEGLRNLKDAGLERLDRNVDGLRKLAETYLRKKGHG